MSAVNKAVSELFYVSTKSNDGEEILTQFKEKVSNVKITNKKYMILMCLQKVGLNKIYCSNLVYLLR